MSSPALTPVTIIGGYLGAGKTTLVNSLLHSEHGRRLAVLVNDFGEINIDVDLIASHDGETVSLQNGCICCSLADGLGAGLDQVLAVEPPVDQIVIEASGVAEPSKIAAYGQGWPGCRLDAMIVLADAETIRSKARDRYVGDLVLRQLANADLIVLTKTDLIDDDQVAAVREWIREQADAPVIAAAHGQVPVGLVLDIGGSAAGGTAPSDPGQSAEDLFETATVDLPQPVDRDRLEDTISTWPDSVVRAKGLVRVGSGDADWVVVQRVGKRCSIEPTPEAVPPDSASRIVLITTRGTLGHLDPAADLLAAGS